MFPTKQMSTQQTARQKFAALIGVEPQQVRIEPNSYFLETGFHYGFTTGKVHLSSRNNIGFELNSELEEPTIRILECADGLVFPINAGSPIIFVIPAEGRNSSPVWTTAKELQIITDKMRDATIVRVYRTTSRDGKIVSRGRVHFWTGFWSQLTHPNSDFANDFKAYEENGYQFNFVFQSRKGAEGEWKDIPDPRIKAVVEKPITQTAPVVEEVKAEADPVVTGEAKVKKPKAAKAPKAPAAKLKAQGKRKNAKPEAEVEPVVAETLETKDAKPTRKEVLAKPIERRIKPRNPVAA